MSGTFKLFVCKETYATHRQMEMLNKLFSISIEILTVQTVCTECIRNNHWLLCKQNANVEGKKMNGASPNAKINKYICRCEQKTLVLLPFSTGAFLKKSIRSRFASSRGSFFFLCPFCSVHLLSYGSLFVVWKISRYIQSLTLVVMR